MTAASAGRNAVDKRELEQLIELLTAQCGVLKELVSVAGRQKQALLDGDQPGVEATTKEQDELLAELERYEVERLALLSDAAPDSADGVADGAAVDAADRSVDAENAVAAVTLEQIIENAPGEYADKLVALRDEARSLVGDLIALNDTNAQLLHQELALLDLYMSILSPDSGTDVYGDPARGRRPAGGSSVAFDTRA